MTELLHLFALKLEEMQETNAPVLVVMSKNKQLWFKPNERYGDPRYLFASKAKVVWECGRPDPMFSYQERGWERVALEVVDPDYEFNWVSHVEMAT